MFHVGASAASLHRAGLLCKFIKFGAVRPCKVGSGVFRPQVSHESCRHMLFYRGPLESTCGLFAGGFAFHYGIRGGGAASIVLHDPVEVQAVVPQFANFDGAHSVAVPPLYSHGFPPWEAVGFELNALRIGVMTYHCHVPKVWYQCRITCHSCVPRVERVVGYCSPHRLCH